jgi:hypothetical protein
MQPCLVFYIKLLELVLLDTKIVNNIKLKQLL